MKLKLLAEAYCGEDFITGVNLTLKKGFEVEVSKEKGEQMLRDFPNDFEVLDSAEAVSLPENPVKKKRKK